MTGIVRVATGLQRVGVWPFVTAGYPDIASTAGLLAAVQRAGAAGVEVGFPYSDPIADGPVIQTSFTRALNRGLRVHDVFAAVAQARRAGVELPLLAMVSYSIVHRIGPVMFCEQAATAGFDGLIVPDLSLEEAPHLTSAADSCGIAVNMLVAPTTPDERRTRIAALSTGFTYYMSVAGVTGERRELPTGLAGHVAALRRASGRPVCVGFGISTARQVADVARVADGVIVGSALIRQLTRAINDGVHGTALDTVAEQFVRDLQADLPV